MRGVLLVGYYLLFVASALPVVPFCMLCVFNISPTEDFAVIVVLAGVGIAALPVAHLTRDTRWVHLALIGVGAIFVPLFYWLAIEAMAESARQDARNGFGAWIQTARSSTYYVLAGWAAVCNMTGTLGVFASELGE